MWPSRSKTSQRPSGDKSTAIHVPSLVVKSMSRIWPRARVTSHSRERALSCCDAADTGMRTAARANERAIRDMSKTPLETELARFFTTEDTEDTEKLEDHRYRLPSVPSVSSVVQALLFLRTEKSKQSGRA